MPTYLTFACHGPTRATREGRFPGDDDLEPGAAAQSVLGRAHFDQVWVSPMLSTRQTASALGVDRRGRLQADALRDCDYGRWKGRSIGEIFKAEPALIQAWRTDLGAAPHGGESLAAVGIRVRGWLDERMRDPGHILAVTHASVMRFAVMAVLDAPEQSFWNIDIEPSSRVELSSDGRRWALRTVTSASPGSESTTPPAAR